MTTTWFNLPAQIDAILSQNRALLAQGAKLMSAVSDAAAAVAADLDAIKTKLDGEGASIQSVLAMLQQGTPDVAAAVAALQGVHVRLGDIGATVDQHKATLDGAVTPPPVTPTP